MKTKLMYLITLIIALCAGKVNAQIVIPTQTVETSARTVSAFAQSLSTYTVFTMDKRELLNELHTNKSALFQMRINENLDWTFDMVVNDMRAPNFRQVIITDEGEIECNGFVLNTFKGKTTDGRIARFTIDENTFFGVVLGENYPAGADLQSVPINH